MKNIKNLFYTFGFLASLLFVSCGDSVPAGGFLVKGNIANANDITSYFDKIDLNNAMESVAKTTASNGKFSIPLESKPEKGMYRVRIGAKSALLLLDGSETQVEITGDLNTLQDGYTVTGSELSNELISKLKKLRAKEIKTQEFDTYLTNEADPFLAMALSVSEYSSDDSKHEIFSKISNKLSEKYGAEDQLVKDYKSLANKLTKTYAKNQAKYKVRVGQPAPEIVSKTPEGKTKKLSDLKGQVVLLDFWASWCGPCRRANPHVVKMYDKYNKKGFTVFNVSLDGLDSRTKARFKTNDQIAQQMEAQKKRWTAAIEKDNLKWPHHVSDLKKWDSDAAAAYGVRSIPSTFLIDKDGNLAVLNPNKGSMESEILKLL